MKFVEVMKMTTREQRLKLLEEANYNLFKIPAEYCLIDLLTDSGHSYSPLMRLIQIALALSSCCFHLRIIGCMNRLDN